MDNSGYIRTAQQLSFMFHLQSLQVVMNPLEDLVFFVLGVLEDSCFVSVSKILSSGM
jgi:hypothetical protein